jgi:hypothetical protein
MIIILRQSSGFIRPVYTDSRSDISHLPPGRSSGSGKRCCIPARESRCPILNCCPQPILNCCPQPILNCCPQPVQARGFRRIKPLVISGKLSKISRLEVKILRQAKGFDIELERS